MAILKDKGKPYAFDDIAQLIADALKRGDDSIEVRPKVGESLVRLEIYPKKGFGIIDVENVLWSNLSDKGLVNKKTGKPIIQGLYDKKQLELLFKKVRKLLPPGTKWDLNADTAQKHRIYTNRLLKEDIRAGTIKVLTDDPAMTKLGRPHMLMTIPEGGKYILDDIPPHIAWATFYEYLANREEARIKEIAEGLKPNSIQARAKFEFDGEEYTWQKRNGGQFTDEAGNGFQLRRSKEQAIKEANRRATKLGLTPTMTANEWLEIKRLYDFAGKHGYHVDHIIPLQPLDPRSPRGLHHPSNLQVLDENDNLIKGARTDIPVTPKAVEQGPMTHKNWEWAQNQTKRMELNPKAGRLLGYGIGGGILSSFVTPVVRAASAVPLEGVTFGLWKGLDVAVANWSREDLQEAERQYELEPTLERKEQLDYARRQLAFDVGSVGDPTFVSDVGGIVNAFSNPNVRRFGEKVQRGIANKIFK